MDSSIQLHRMAGWNFRRLNLEQLVPAVIRTAPLDLLMRFSTFLKVKLALQQDIVKLVGNLHTSATLDWTRRDSHFLKSD